MSKCLMAIVAAGVGFGLNVAIVSSVDAAPAPKSWSDFKVMVKKCNELTGAEQKQCMTDARDTYRASNYNCESMSQADRTQCLRYRDQWKSAAATSDSKSAVTHTEDPTMTPSDPGDPSASERNRDSTKQQEDAAGNLPEPKPQNQ